MKHIHSQELLRRSNGTFHRCVHCRFTEALRDSGSCQTHETSRMVWGCCSCLSCLYNRQTEVNQNCFTPPNLTLHTADQGSPGHLLCSLLASLHPTTLPRGSLCRDTEQHLTPNAASCHTSWVSVPAPRSHLSLSDFASQDRTTLWRAWHHTEPQTMENSRAQVLGLHAHSLPFLKWAFHWVDFDPCLFSRSWLWKLVSGKCWRKRSRLSQTAEQTQHCVLRADRTALENLNQLRPQAHLASLKLSDLVIIEPS